MSDLTTFKSNCKDEIKRSIDLGDEWLKLYRRQKQYGKSFKPISKIFNGKFCPNCNTKLSVIENFTNPQPCSCAFYSKVSILICDECGYKFAHELSF